MALRMLIFFVGNAFAPCAAFRLLNWSGRALTNFQRYRMRKFNVNAGSNHYHPWFFDDLLVSAVYFIIASNYSPTEKGETMKVRSN